MATIYVLLLLTVALLVAFVCYAAWPRSKKGTVHSEAKTVQRGPATRAGTQTGKPVELPQLDFPKSDASAAHEYRGSGLVDRVLSRRAEIDCGFN